jgi:hypothetical protein
MREFSRQLPNQSHAGGVSQFCGAIMKKALRLLVVGSLVIFYSQINAAFAQGSLTPPGAPAPTMKTLAQVEPRTPISSLPYTITNSGSFYVTTNLTGVGGQNGIVINAGNVVVDLSGFTLRGVPPALSGVYISGVTNVTVRNGTLTEWGRAGIDASSASPRNMVFENLVVSQNLGDGLDAQAGSFINHCSSYNNAFAGITCNGGEVVECMASTNGSDGIVAQNCTVRGSRSEYNRGMGISIANGSVLECTAEHNATAGFYGNGGYNEVRRCRATSNGSQAGIYMAGSGSGVVSDCFCVNNAGYGIEIFGTGFLIIGNSCTGNTGGGISIQNMNNRIEGNNVLTQARIVGIEVPSNSNSNNVIVRNSVTGGGGTSFNYSVSLYNDLAPTGSAAAASNPYANISH